MASISGSQILVFIIIGFLLYGIALTVYRVTLHPLARFPGPKLAGMTYWYEFYQDVIRPGRYIFKIKELHEQYGPVLRVNPNEIHFSDPEFYTEIYSSKPHKADRDPWYDLDFIPGAITFTKPHDVHARRRQSLLNYFSMKAIRTLESRITAVASLMAERLHQLKETGAVVDLTDVFVAFGLDVVSEYSLGKSGSMNLMSHPEFGKMWTDMGKLQIPMIPLIRHYKFIMRLSMAMPDWLALRIVPFVAGYLRWQEDLQRQIMVSLERTSGGKHDGEISQHTIILDELIASPELTTEDKAPARLKDEATILLGAGSETTATTLSRTAFHLLSHPKSLAKLRQELQNALPNSQEIPSLDSLANLPYLNAVIEEGLRISLPVVQRSPRIFHDHSLQYRSWTIPAKTAVSQASLMVLTNSTIFPNPLEFQPERWIDNPSLQKYQVTFSKGRRMCLGINLAYAELRLALAVVFRRFELALYETTRRDATAVHDFQVGYPPRDSKGIRVQVVGEVH